MDLGRVIIVGDPKVVRGRGGSNVMFHFPRKGCHQRVISHVSFFLFLSLLLFILSHVRYDTKSIPLTSSSGSVVLSSFHSVPAV